MSLKNVQKMIIIIFFRVIPFLLCILDGCLIQLNLYQESPKRVSCSKNERFIDRNPFGAFLALLL